MIFVRDYNNIARRNLGARPARRRRKIEQVWYCTSSKAHTTMHGQEIIHNDDIISFYSYRTASVLLDHQALKAPPGTS